MGAPKNQQEDWARVVLFAHFLLCLVPLYPSLKQPFSEWGSCPTVLGGPCCQNYGRKRRRVAVEKRGWWICMAGGASRQSLDSPDELAADGWQWGARRWVTLRGWLVCQLPAPVGVVRSGAESYSYVEEGGWRTPELSYSLAPLPHINWPALLLSIHPRGHYCR